MSLVGIEYAFVLPLLLLAHWLLPRRAGVQNAFLLAVSYLFYASWNWRFVPLLLLATAADYLLAIGIDDRRPADGDDSVEADRARRRMRVLLAASVAVNLGVLGWFKYSGFFVDSLASLLGSVGLPVSLPVLRILLPLGVSFFTLQKLGYVVDVYYGRVRASRSPVQFALFVAFFPQLTAGPISRAAQLLPQLATPRRLTPELVSAGVGALVLGYVLKALVADWIGPNVVDPVFAAPDSFSVAAHWLAAVGYALQVFGDFAGYSLLAIGTGQLLGIGLPTNFDYPFLSRSLPEFWRRWHITLNTWLFDYVYNPLVTGQGGMRGRLDAGMMVVFLASGLWHGASATFVLWGALHGVGMIVHRRWDAFYRDLCRRDRKWVARRRLASYAAASWAVTQLFFVLTLVPFRAPSFTQMSSFARGLVTSPGTGFPELTALPVLVVLAGIVTFLVGYHLAALPATRRLWERFVAMPAPVRGFAYGMAIVYLLLFLPLGASTFIYRQF